MIFSDLSLKFDDLIRLALKGPDFIDLNSMVLYYDGSADEKTLRKFLENFSEYEQRLRTHPKLAPTRTAQDLFSASLLHKTYRNLELTKKALLHLDPRGQTLIYALLLSAREVFQYLSGKFPEVIDLIADSTIAAIEILQNDQDLMEEAVCPDLFSQEHESTFQKSLFRLFVRNLENPEIIAQHITSLAKTLSDFDVSYKKRESSNNFYTQSDMNFTKKRTPVRFYLEEFGGDFLDKLFEENKADPAFPEGLYRLTSNIS